MSGYRTQLLENLKRDYSDVDRIDISGGCKTSGNCFFGMKTTSFINLDIYDSNGNKRKVEQQIYRKRHRGKHTKDARSIATHELARTAKELKVYFSDTNVDVFDSINDF